MLARGGRRTVSRRRKHRHPRATDALEKPVLLAVTRYPALTQSSMRSEAQPGGLGDMWVENLLGGCGWEGEMIPPFEISKRVSASEDFGLNSDYLLDTRILGKLTFLNPRFFKCRTERKPPPTQNKCRC